ncbi:hypothetical protein ASF66_05410 [Pseudomonas sp. Leaf129]|uniref:hypothetical protein n=1 Tax=Pseudomonas sp. Leaf129 TaxID=1736268 RepID=UPI0007031FC8|nr:hypothetical protein [Pseudomonas sp. Leaf129]KQQ63771.1 hypothetical protein ASF66_05410 [Pseudomonas sp. Leaf129]
MIQRPAAGTFDLELNELAHAGKQSFAFTASAIFQHLLIPSISVTLAVGRKNVANGQAGALRVASPAKATFRFCNVQKREGPEMFGAFAFLSGIKKPDAGSGV